MPDQEYKSHDLDPAAPAAASAESTQRTTPARRGFAAMDRQRQREIARKGGHSQGKQNNLGNFWHDRERARAAGRKGGQAHGKHRREEPSPAIND